MEIDFYDQFNRYTNVELLALIRQPGQYQPEAVAAAQQLLRERNISPEDEEETDRLLQEIENERSARSATVDHYKEKIADIMEPVLVPGNEVVPAKWYRLFLVMFCIYYAWAFYNFIKHQIRFLQCERCTMDITIWGAGVNMAYLTVVLFMLLKNKRWAWILLTVGNISALCTNVILLYDLYKYRDILRPGRDAVIITQLLPVITILFLARPSIIEFFGVHRKIKQRTFGAGIAFGILYCAVILGT